MEPEDFSTLPIDVNANFCPKELHGPDNPAVGHVDFEASWELLQLPFFQADIIQVFEICARIKPRKPKRKDRWKRRWRSRCLKFSVTKRSVKETKMILDQQKVTEVQKAHAIKSEIDKGLETILTDVCEHQEKGTSLLNIEFSQTLQSNESTTEYENTTKKRLEKMEILPKRFQEDYPDTRIENKHDKRLDYVPQETPECTDHLNEGKVCDMLDSCAPKEKTESGFMTESFCSTDIKHSNHGTCKQICAVTEEQKKSPDANQIANTEKKPLKTRPNYFVAIPITNEQILDIIEDVQEHIVLNEPKLLRALIPAEKVHITILVAHLQTEEEVKRAVFALNQCKSKVESLLEGKPFTMTLHGIGEFNNQVIYIKITENEQQLLCKIAETVTQSFSELNVDMSGTKEFRPHLTFLKLSKAPSLRRKGFKKICNELYKEYEDSFFGTELLTRIDLCSMHKKNKQSGYFYCECSIFINGITTVFDIQKDEIKESNMDCKKESSNVDSEETAKGILTLLDNSLISCAENGNDKITLDITDATTINKEKKIRETDELLEAVNINPGEEACCVLTPDLFPPQLIASAAVNKGPEK